MIPGFDIVSPLYMHDGFHQYLKQYQIAKTKKFFATFMGTRYRVSTCSREALRIIDNGSDIIVRFHCYDTDKDCIKDENVITIIHFYFSAKSYYY